MEGCLLLSRTFWLRSLSLRVSKFRVGWLLEIFYSYEARERVLDVLCYCMSKDGGFNKDLTYPAM